MYHFKLNLLFLFLTVLLTTGCSDSSSSNNLADPNDMMGGDNPPATLTLNGNAADGYLQGATVCLDSDGDRSCAGEATATTTSEGGAFSLTATAEDFASLPIITQVVAGTVDEDTITDGNPQGTPITEEQVYTLSAPPGSVAATDADEDGTIDAAVFVSPITTLVENERQRLVANDPENSEALAQARTSVAEQLGVESVDELSENYVAIQEDEEADQAVKAAALQLHTTARVVAALLTDAEADIAEAIASGAVADEDNSVAAQTALAQITSSLDAISAQVDELLMGLDTDEATAEDLVSHVQTIANANDVVDTETLPDLVDSAGVEATAVTAADVLQRDGGIWIVDLEVDDYGDSLSLDSLATNFGFIPADGDTPARSIDDCYVIDLESGELSLDEAPDSTEIVLTADGWTAREIEAGDGCDLAWTIGDDGGVSGTSTNDIYDESVSLNASAQQLDLQDQSIVGLLSLHDTVSDVHWPNVLQENAQFSSTDVVGFVLTGVSVENELYSLGSPDDIMNSSNTVGYHLGSDTFEPLLESLDTIVHPAGTQLIDDAGALDDTLAFIDIGFSPSNQGGTNFSVFLAGDTATYFSRKWNPQTGQQENTELGTTPFTLETVNGERLLEIPVINELAGADLYYSVDNTESGKPFVFTEYESAVRFVFAEPEEQDSFSILALNETARDDVIAALHTDNLDIRAELPANLAALSSRVGAAFQEAGITVFYTTKWNFGARGFIWGVSESLTDADDGAAVRLQNFPGGYFTNRVSAATLTVSEGIFATRTESIERTYSDGTVENVSLDPELFIGVATGSTGEGQDEVIAACFKSASAIESGDFDCSSANEDIITFLSESESAIETKAAELNAAAHTTDFDQVQFVGNTFYSVQIDDVVDGVVDGFIDEITLNDDATNSVDLVGPGISNVQLTYEFVAPYAVKFQGSFLEEGESVTVSDFVILREHYASDDVYSVCWKGPEEDVRSVTEAVIACALDFETDVDRSVVTFSRETAESILEAGGYTPTTTTTSPTTTDS